MLQMVRTLAQFSIALDEMQENGENTSEEGRQEREEGGGEELMDRDAADRHGNTNGNGTGSANGNGTGNTNRNGTGSANGNVANGNGLGAVSPQNHGEVDQCVCLKGIPCLHSSLFHPSLLSSLMHILSQSHSAIGRD